MPPPSPHTGPLTHSNAPIASLVLPSDLKTLLYTRDLSAVSHAVVKGKVGALFLRAWRTGLLSRSVATSETVERPANLSGAGWKLEPIWQIDSDDPWGLKRGH